MSRSFLFIIAAALVLAVDGCGTTPKTTSATRLYNHWLGYGYVYAGQTIVSRFALTDVATHKSYAITSNAGVIVHDFSISGQSSDPWRTVELDWSLSRMGRNHLVPLEVSVSSGRKETSLKLGKWYVDVLQKPNASPLQEKRQSVGEDLTEMPNTYPFSIQLSINGIDVPKDLSLITNADPHVVKIVVKKIARTGREIGIHGVISFINKSNQIYLIPALSYMYGNTKYVQPLLPMAFAVFPSSQTQSFSDGNITL